MSHVNSFWEGNAMSDWSDGGLGQTIRGTLAAIMSLVKFSTSRLAPIRVRHESVSIIVRFFEFIRHSIHRVALRKTQNHCITHLRLNHPNVKDCKFLRGALFVAVVGSVVWAFPRLKKPRGREMSARSYALHSILTQISFPSFLWWPGARA